MEEPSPQSEERSAARYAVDVEAQLVIVSQCGTVSGRMFELREDGCRVRAEGHCAIATPAGIEVLFKINGIAFRLAGTMRWAEGHLTAEVGFNPMAERRREALLDVLAELQAPQEAGAGKECASPHIDEPVSRATPQSAVSAGPGLRKPDARLSAEKYVPMSSSAGVPRPPSIAPCPKAEAQAEQGVEPQKPAGRPVGRERREQSRQMVDTRATLYFIDVRAEISGRILDVSMSGCRIRSDERFPVGIYRRVETEFTLDCMPFCLAGVVQALHDNHTVGIRFLNVSARKREQLELLMQEIKDMKESGAPRLADQSIAANTPAVLQIPERGTESRHG